MAADIVAILKMAPLAGTALQRYRRSNLSKTLDRLVQAELEADPVLGPNVTEELLNQWFFIHNDGRGAVVIAALLREGDMAYVEALRKRATELLAGLETLLWDVPDVVERIVRAVENNFVAAQKDELNAAQRGTSAVLSVVEPLATREDVLASGEDVVTTLERMLTPPAPRVILLASSFDEDQRRHLDELIAADPAAAGRLGPMLQTAGDEGLRGLVRSRPAWAIDQPAAFWRATARVLRDAGQLGEAAGAFLLEADRPDVEDRAKALIDAARCAEADSPEAKAAADSHLAKAQAIAPNHPMVQLFLASRADDPEDRLRLTDDVVVVDDQQRARKESQRATALLGLARPAEAREAAQRSLAADPHGGGDELASLATILEEHNQGVRGRDDRPLIDAVAHQLSLHHKLRASGRLSMAGVAGARAALGSAVLGDRAAARELIARIGESSEMLALPEARAQLIEAALAVQDVELARGLLDEPDRAPENRYLHATIAVLAQEDLREAVTALDVLVEELEPGWLRTQVIKMRGWSPQKIPQLSSIRRSPRGSTMHLGLWRTYRRPDCYARTTSLQRELQ